MRPPTTSQHISLTIVSGIEATSANSVPRKTRNHAHISSLWRVCSDAHPSRREHWTARTTQLSWAC